MQNSFLSLFQWLRANVYANATQGLVIIDKISINVQ